MSESSEDATPGEPGPAVYAFGDYRLEPGRRVLLHGGESMPLPSRAFDTLLYLVRNPGRVVTKDELMAAVWPDAFVEENNLNQSISALRRALGEARGENRYVATVPGRGYRFVADVSAGVTPTATDPGVPAGPVAIASEAATAPSSTAVVDRSMRPPRPHRLMVFAAAGVVVIALVVVAGVTWRQATARPVVRRLAVLPFKPLVLATRDESLEVGMADTLIAKLSVVRGLTVRQLSAVRAFGGQTQDPGAAGRSLGVDAVLDGQIQRHDDRIRVTAQLLRVDDEKALWSGQFDAQSTDIFAVQDAISERVARELAITITDDERQHLATHQTRDAQAYELYLKGRFVLAPTKHDAVVKAIGFFEQATTRDPHYALAHAWLGRCYTMLPISSDVPPGDAFAKAAASARRALDLDPHSVDANTVLGWVALWHDWDWVEAEARFRRALALDPGDALAHVGYGHLLSDLGRHDDAIREGNLALGLDPVSVYGETLKAHYYYQARRYPEALEHVQRALELDPAFWIAQITLGKIEEQLNRHDEAVAAFGRARALSGGNAEPISLRGHADAVAGHRDKALEALRELADLGQRQYVPAHYVALIHQGLGDSTEALRWLERGYQQRDVHLVFLKVDPKWDGLRADPRFVSLLERMKLLP